MNCDEVRPVLLDYVMQEVPPQDRAGLALHLETCAACSEQAGKFRQTLGALAQGAAFEEVPQKIRIVAEPAGRAAHWIAAFWRAPARLAFAGGALACLAIAILALARTTITYQQGNLEIAFGVAATAIQSPANQSPAAAPLPNSGIFAPVTAPEGLTRNEIEQLIAAAVAASEARQMADTTRIVQASAQQAETNRTNERDRDRRELAESFRYFQAAQVNMWKQQVESQQVMSALLQRTGVDVAPQP
ncbi:MAG: zf-HC2 domain-containing protein [Acidobacteria bacterium]|nr:zf-HC2 domain-containing protein [Acidobacteriota bacterium]